MSGRLVEILGVLVVTSGLIVGACVLEVTKAVAPVTILGGLSLALICVPRRSEQTQLPANGSSPSSSLK